MNDATTASAGWYWQFNRKQGFSHDGTTRTPNTAWITLWNESLDWGASADPGAILLGTGWRMPTQTEWDNAVAAGAWTNQSKLFNSVLKIHVAGRLDANTGDLQTGTLYIWSQTSRINTSGYCITSTTVAMTKSIVKRQGCSVRCVRD